MWFDGIKYIGYVLLAHFWKYTFAAWNRIKVWWAPLPSDRKMALIALVVIVAAVATAKADHTTPPYNKDLRNFFHLESSMGGIVCENESDDGIHACWPYVDSQLGPVFVEHGWCADVTDTEGGDRYVCGSTREEVKAGREEVDGTNI